MPACDGRTDRQTDTRRQHVPRWYGVARQKKNISTVYGTTTRPWKAKKRGDYGCGGDITSEEELWSLQSIKQQLATQAAIDFCPGTPAGLRHYQPVNHSVSIERVSIISVTQSHRRALTASRTFVFRCRPTVSKLASQ